MNNLDVCKGEITRTRKTVKGEERSILDFFLICERLKLFLTKMLVDEEKLYSLSNYSKVKGKVDSDHNTLVMDLNIIFSRKKPSRDEYFNFKNKECQELFHSETSNTTEFSECLENEKSIEVEGGKWFSTLNKYFHKTFKKIRFNGKVKETPVTKLMDLRRETVQNLKKCDDYQKEELENKLSEVENEIADMVAEENRIKVVENLEKLSDTDGLVNTNGMWNLKRKIFPKNKESLPFAKQDFDGKLITSQNSLKTLYLETFVHRLRHRPMKDELLFIQKIKEELCEERIKLSKLSKSAPWTPEDLKKVLKDLKKNKCRDPHGIINEIVKPGVIGSSLESSLLTLLNRVKEEISIPEFMQYANIVSIYKGKGEKSNLKNDRGIFIVNIFRSILMKLVYRDKYPTVDENMSDSQIGARKHKNIRNHIFVLNGIINEALNTKGKAIDILIYDYRQCFDTLWLDECINDLFDAGIKDDKLALIYEANKVNKVAVKTPFGLTQRENINKIVLQGEVFGPLQCSVQVDTFGKECVQENKFLYTYKEKVKVPALSMVDDLACVAESGLDSVELNSFINTKTNLKKLQFGVEKCHQLHIGGKDHLTPNLHIDNWEIKKICETKTGVNNLEDVNSGEVMVETADKDTYLGDIISKDGKNIKNIMARKAKGHGIINQISAMLEDICYGPYQIEVALIYRNSLLLNGILTNCEVWYGLTGIDISHLEQIDEIFLRKILEVPSSCPKCMLYLETGCKPVRFIIKTRRLMFLQYILKEDPNSLISQFFHAQDSQPMKNDWALTCRKDMEELDLKETFEEIRGMSKQKFKNLVSKATTKMALSYLLAEKNRLSKVLHIQFSELKIQKYLLPNVASLKLAKFMYHARSRMLDLKVNYKNKHQSDILCPVCKDPNSSDSQEHLLHCASLSDSQIVQGVPKYADLFSADVKSQITIAAIMEKKFLKRKSILKQRN